MLHRLWLIVCSFLRRLSTRLWRVAWMAVWRQLQIIRGAKPPDSRSGLSPLSDSHIYPQISIQDSRVPSSRLGWVRNSSFCELPETNGNLQLESTSYTSHSTSVPFFTSVEGSSDIESDDSARDFVIPIRGLPSGNLPNQSEDLAHYPEFQQGEITSVEGGSLWSAHGPSINTLPNEPNSHYRSASHSLHSSPRSFASTRDTLHDISLQSTSVEYQTRQAYGSRVSIIISPVALPDNNLPEYRSFRNDSTLSVADHIYPLIPTKLKRYQRSRTLPSCEVPEVRLRPAVRDIPERFVPEGWVQHIHPEGRPIFYNKEKNILTESWLFEDDVYNCLTICYSLLEDFIKAGRYEVPPGCHLVLDVEEKIEGTDQYWCGYYYVSHSTRCVFWLEACDISELFNAAEAEVEDPHIKIQLEYQYWYHWELFPNANELTLPILDSMANHIRDVRADLLTSSENTVPFSLEEINNWASIVRDAREQMIHGEPPTTWFVGKFMAFLCYSRFHNFYGQYGARLSRTQSILGLPQHHRSYLIETLSPLMFSAPDVHLKVLEGLWVDKLIVQPPWSEFFAQLVEEWKGHTVYASILLNANVAFLAIPSNDPGDDTIRYRSPAQIASYLSVIASSASMLLALLLLRRYHKRNYSSAQDISNLLKKNYHPTHGLETLAILHSLPYALLLWGLVTFFVAFFIMCFQVSNTVTRSVVGVACFLAGFLVVWCVWNGWEESPDHWQSPLSVKRWTRRAQGNSRILNEGEDEGVLGESDSPQKLFNWPWLRRFGRKPTTSPSDAENPSLR